MFAFYAVSITQIWLSTLSQIRNSKEVVHVFVTVKDLATTILLVLGLNALILTIWTVHAPMQWTVVFDRSTDAFGRPLTSYGLCSSRSNMDTVYLWILGCCNIAILLVFNYLAYRLSGVQTENYEHEYISLAYISGLEVFVVGMPFLASKLVIPRTSATRPHFI